MKNPIKQTVYLPVKQGQTTKTVICDTGEAFPVKQMEGYFFTPEQLNEYTANVIKQALETAAEKAEIKYDHFDDMAAYINTASIKNTFDITFQQYKV